MLNTDLLGRVSEFAAVPGCGLKCLVSNVEPILRADITDVDILNRRNSSVSSKVTFGFAGRAADEVTSTTRTIEGIAMLHFIYPCQCGFSGGFLDCVRLKLYSCRSERQCITTTRSYYFPISGFHTSGIADTS